MKKTIRLTEDDLTRIVRRVLKEQERNNPDPVSDENIPDEGGGDEDYWKMTIKPILSKNGWKEVVGNGNNCPNHCCTYMFKGNRETGPKIILDCGNNPFRDPWNLIVYTKNQQSKKLFGTDTNGARKAVAYALTLI